MSCKQRFGGLFAPIGEGLDTDNDADGFNAPDSCHYGLGIDCDDNNPLVYPGAAEECNNIDDDCDEVVDNGTATDADGDNYTVGCSSDPEASEVEDCFDEDADVHPYQEQFIWGAVNGGDYNCDGAIEQEPDPPYGPCDAPTIVPWTWHWDTWGCLETPCLEGSMTCGDSKEAAYCKWHPWEDCAYYPNLNCCRHEHTGIDVNIKCR